jgi:hypothetical protein
MRIAKPLVWMLASILMPVGFLFAFSFPMDSTPAQRVVWVLTGWFVLIWTLTLVVRLLRTNKPTAGAASPTEMVEEGKTNG